MAMKFSTTLRNNRASQIRALLDAGTSNGQIRLYDGVRPAVGGGAPTTLLATIPLSKPCAPDPVGGVMTLVTPMEGPPAEATGKVTWARLTDSEGTFVVDMDVSKTGGGGDIQLVSDDLTAGMPVRITSATLTEGNG